MRHYIWKLKFKFWLWCKMVFWRKELMDAYVTYNNKPTEHNKRVCEIMSLHLHELAVIKDWL